MENSKVRIAVINPERCKPNKCDQQCRRICPINNKGKVCISVPLSKAIIDENSCIACGNCIKTCPFDAIRIVNLPSETNKLTTHRFGPNQFKLHRLPIPKTGLVLGLVGPNGTGKTTCLQILTQKIKPNLGEYSKPPEWNDIIKNFRGSELQNYYKRLINEQLQNSYKIQNVHEIPNLISGTVKEIIASHNPDENSQGAFKNLDLEHLLDRKIDELSGGELQRLAIYLTLSKDSSIYIFDEPSSFLDVKQRLRASQQIRALSAESNYVITVEHDLSILDYMSDIVHCVYGEPGTYGIVTTPYSAREGINIFLSGYIPTENMRFRKEEINFKSREEIIPIPSREKKLNSYDSFEKNYKDFKLQVGQGSFETGQITVMFGENGTGKTTMLKVLAGKDDEVKSGIPKVTYSYKSQSVIPKIKGKVGDVLSKVMGSLLTDLEFDHEVLKPLQIQSILTNDIEKLSGGEMQRIALALCLAKDADIYLIDEPSAFLDSDQRVKVAKMLKRFMINRRKCAFIVEHDFIMATYLADQVIVFEGKPGIECEASSPLSLVEGINKFLMMLEITFRRDLSNFRPRINKLNSVKDKEQKLAGEYFVLEE